MFYGKFSDDSRPKFHQSLQLLLSIFGRVFAHDNLIALGRAAGFAEDPVFIEAFKRNAKTDQDMSIIWRVHTLAWAANHCRHVPGDFVECGVFRGFSMAVIADYLKFDSVNKSMYLYDTFEGIPDEMNSEKRSNAASEKENAEGPGSLAGAVRELFAKYPNVKIVQGTVPQSFEQACPEKVAFLHIDMNSSKSEIAALDALFDRVSPGGIIIFDDYGWHNYRQQKAAEDAYMAERGYQILEIPTGQGMVIKR